MTYTAVVRNAASGSERAMGVGAWGTVWKTRKVEVVMQKPMPSRLDICRTKPG